MKFRDMTSELIKLGYYLKRVAGSHYIFVHPNATKPVILLHNSKNKDFGPSFVRRTLKEASNNLILERVL